MSRQEAWGKPVIILEDHNCILGYICIEKRCGFYETCDIYQKIRNMAKYRKKYWMKGDKKFKNGKASAWQIIMLLLITLRDGFECPDCNRKMIIGGNLPESATIDHIIPRCRGGNNSWPDLRVCCGECNQKKSEKENPCRNLYEQIATHKTNLIKN